MSNNDGDPSAKMMYPRFILRALPRSLGLILVLAGGLWGTCTILSTIGEESKAMVVISIFLAVCLAVVFLMGVLLLLMPLEKIRVSRAGIQLCLGHLVLRNIPKERIRSVNGSPREVRVSHTDRQIYLLRCNCYGSFPLYMEWSAPLEEALRRELPDINLFC